MENATLAWTASWSRGMAGGVLVLVVLAGCASTGPTTDEPAGEATTPAASTAPPETAEAIDPAQRCTTSPEELLPVTRDLEPLVIDSPSGAQLYAVVAGSGSRGVVLVGGGSYREAGVCYWLPTLGWLPDQGFQVLTYDKRCTYESTCSDEVRVVDDMYAAVDALRERGAMHVVLVGASGSGADAILAATRADAGLDGLVSLSSFKVRAETRSVDSEYAVPFDAVRHITVPTMYTMAEGDLALTVSEVQQMYEATPTEGSSVHILPERSGHAQTLLFTDEEALESSEFAQTFLDFLRANTGG